MKLDHIPNGARRLSDTDHLPQFVTVLNLNMSTVGTLSHGMSLSNALA